MKHITRLLGLLFIVFISSCAKEAKQVDNEFGNIPEKLKAELTNIGAKKQYFSIQTNQANTIVGKEGTIILIPKESIVDETGKLVTDSVIIELKEHFQLADYVLSNLQTVSNDSLLVSKGMVFVSAKDKNGKNLKIAEGKKIRFEIPMPNYKNNSEIFIGQRDDIGLINWELPEKQTKDLIPFPIRFISKNRFATECSDYYGITTDTINDQYYNYFGNIVDFENTLLATKEFRDRFSWYCWREILEIYIDNLEKNMWEIDELVVEHLKIDSARRVDEYLNTTPPIVHGNSVTSEQWRARAELIKMTKESCMWSIKTFEFFASQKLTKLDTTQLIDTTKIEDLNKAFISYSALDFGWVNVDYFYKDPNSKPVKLIAKTNEKTPLINLIIKNKNIILTGIDKGNNEYWFTKNENGYNKLPVGDTAIILGIGLVENDIVFDKKEVIIGEQEIIDLTLQKINNERLKSELEELQ